MAGHRDSQPRRDKARAERMRARIAEAPNEFQAMGHAFDWLRMELQHLSRAGQHGDRSRPHAAEAGALARRVTGELIARTESVIQRSDSQ